MYKINESFHGQEADRRIGKHNDGKKSPDSTRRRSQMADDLKVESMKSKDLNLYKLKKSIDNLSEYKDSKYPTTKKHAEKLVEYLQDMYDYKMRWLKEPENSEQLKNELLQDRGIEPQDFHPRYYSKTKVTHGEAIFAYEHADKHFNALKKSDVESASVIEALKQIKPFFRKTHEKINAALNPSPKSPDTIVESPDTIQEEISHKRSSEVSPLVAIEQTTLPQETKDTSSNTRTRKKRQSSDNALKELSKMFTESGRLKQNSGDGKGLYTKYRQGT